MMYRFLLVLALCLMPLAAAAQPRAVALADLAPLSEVQLAELNGPYFKTFEVAVALAGSRARVSDAKGALKAAQRVVEAEDADKKAAKAEVQAAQKNNDSSRLAAAGLVLAGAEADLNVATAFEDWKKAEVKAAEAAASEAEALQDLRAAEFQLAMANAVAKVEGPSAPRYSLDVFHKEVAKANRKVVDLHSKTEGEKAKAAKQKASWEVLAGK